MHRTVSKLRRGAFIAVAVLAASAPALAQRGPGGGPGWGPGMMMGPGMMQGGYGFMCNPRTAGFAEWRVAQIEAAVKPTEPQKALLADLKAASEKAAQIMVSGCPATAPTKPTERMDMAEKRLDAMLQAIRIVRPAFEAFYNALDDKQKASLTTAAPRGWGWRGWRWQ